MRLAIAILLIALSANGQFLSRLVIPPKKAPRPFSLSFTSDQSCRPAGFTLRYSDDKGRNYSQEFAPGAPLVITNLYVSNRYSFDAGMCNLLDQRADPVQWRPTLTNVVSLWVEGGNVLTKTNPPASKFWMLHTNSPTDAYLMQADNLGIKLWISVGRLTYPSNTTPRLLYRKTSNWDGIEAYEHAQ